MEKEEQKSREVQFRVANGFSLNNMRTNVVMKSTSNIKLIDIPNTFNVTFTTQSNKNKQTSRQKRKELNRYMERESFKNMWVGGTLLYRREITHGCK